MLSQVEYTFLYTVPIGAADLSTLQGKRILIF